MVTVKVDIKVKDRGLFAKMARLNRDMALKRDTTLRSLAKAGVYHAASIAPYDTGDTARAIQAKVNQKSQYSASWVITARNGASAHGFKLVEYMHSNAVNADNHFKKDKIRKFMPETARYLNSIKTKVAKSVYKSIALKE